SAQNMGSETVRKGKSGRGTGTRPTGQRERERKRKLCASLSVSFRIAFFTTAWDQAGGRAVRNVAVHELVHKPAHQTPFRCLPASPSSSLPRSLALQSSTRSQANAAFWARHHTPREHGYFWP